MQVLLATHGRPKLLEQSLLSIVRAIQFVGGGRIVLVENGGNWGASEIVKRLEPGQSVEIRLLHAEVANKSLALNHGLKFCDDGLIFLTDDDVEINVNALAQYRNAAEARGLGYFYGGPTHASFESPPPDWLMDFLPDSAKGLTFAKEKSSLPRVKFFLGFNWAAHREDLIAAGGFNSAFGPGSWTGATGQETEMQTQLRQNGAVGIIVHDALVTHEVPIERSTPEWVAKRAFRTGVEGGIRRMRRDPQLLYDLIANEQKRSRYRGLVAGLLRQSPRIFRHQYYNSRLRGFEHSLKFFDNNGQMHQRTGSVDSGVLKAS